MTSAGSQRTKAAADGGQVCPKSCLHWASSSRLLGTWPAQATKGLSTWTLGTAHPGGTGSRPWLFHPSWVAWPSQHPSVHSSQDAHSSSYVHTASSYTSVEYHQPQEAFSAKFPSPLPPEPPLPTLLPLQLARPSSLLQPSLLSLSKDPECPLWAEPSSRRQSRLPSSPAEPKTTRDMMSSGGTSLKDPGWGFDGSRPPSPQGWAQRDGGQPPQPRQGPLASPVPPSIRRRAAVVWKWFGKCFPDAETGLVSLPSGMSVCQQKERTTPHPPPRQPARPAPAFLSKLGSHRAPLPGPRLGRGPHAAPAKLQLPLVLGPSHPRPLNWGFRARTAMSLGSAGSRTRCISSPHLWYLSLGAVDTSSRRPLEVPGCPVACCQPAEREVILASGYRAGTGGARLGFGALDACRGWGWPCISHSSS